MDKYSLSMSEACTFMGVSRPTLAQMIHSGRLTATRKNPSKKQSPYLITRQACIAALNNPIHTVAVSAAEKHEEKPCPSSAEVRSGMQVSRNQAASVLRKVLAQKTNAKRRSCTTDEKQNCGE